MNFSAIKKSVYFPAFLWLLLVSGLSVMPGAQLPKFNLFSIDKLAHAGVYGILTWLLLWGMGRAQPNTPLRPAQVAGAILFATGYGILMEFVQYAFIPGRFYEIDDMIANAVGSVAAWLGWKMMGVLKKTV